METTVGVNSPQAVKRWATSLATDVGRMAYFTKFTGVGSNNIIETKTELEDDAGDEIRFDLSMRLRKKPVFGDNKVVGTEEALTHYQDKVLIDQVRKGVSAGGRMSRKRTLHDYRAIAKERESEYMAEWMDEVKFVYMSGDIGVQGINEDNLVDAAFAGNSITAPDAAHIMYGGAATSKASLVATDKMTVQVVERATTKTEMMNATNPNVIKMQPVMVEGTKRFVMVMSEWQAYDMRTETGDLSWSKIAQAAATAEGRASPIFKGGLGLINNCVLHAHSNIRRFADYGAGANIAACRALLMGRQAAVEAYGSGGRGTRFKWVEEMTDAENQVAIYAGCIYGFKKTTYNGFDYGVLAIDTAAKDPT